MGRPVVLSNGQLFVGLDEYGLVHDFYYPYVGLENLNNARSSHHKIGVWVDGTFKWVEDSTWEIKVNFDDDALITNVTMHSDILQIALVLQDYVDCENNALIRHITVHNDSDQERDVRVFMHQVFQISRAGRADTAIYVPDDHYILDYKGRYCLLISGKFTDGSSFDQYAVGSFNIEGKAGTYVDAEDGELSFNPVEHGGVDSVIRFQKHMTGHDEAIIDYWIIAGSSEMDVQNVHRKYKSQDVSEQMRKTRTTWQDWLQVSENKLPDQQLKGLYHSLMIIKAHCDERGSVLASGDSSIFNYGRDYYCYCWPRDAAYALWPLIRLGHFDEARQFFEFARDTMHKDGYLMHKYQPDRAIGSTWHPLVHNRHKELAIQEDETATVIFVIGEYFKASQDKKFIENIFRSFVAPCANFMCQFIDEKTGLPHASYDLWEEKFLTTTYTVSSVIAGLETAATLAKIVESPDDAIKWQQTADEIRNNLDKLYSPDGYFIKGLLLQENGDIQYDKTLDISSLYGPFMFAGIQLDDPRLTSTAQQIEQRLYNTTPSGGVVRYEDDHYFLAKHQYKGNPWIVSTLWLAQYWLGLNKQDQTEMLINWVRDREFPSGALSEQFDPETGNALGVTPLVWSHAEMLNTQLDLHKLP